MQALRSVPEQGQLALVRQRRYVVTDGRSGVNGGQVAERPQHRVSLTSIEDDALGEELQVIWEIEPGARAFEKMELPEPKGFDQPANLEAFLDAVRWGAASIADTRQLQSPFRSGIEIESYQLDPVVRAIQMPRVNLLIADDVGLGKTIESGMVVLELMLRHRANRILVVCPSSLQIKWRDEMLEKFGLDFAIVDSALIKRLRRERGYRTLAVARGPETGAPTLVGLVSLYDPPRPDAKQLIATLHELGVPVKLLTGDALPVAREIGQGVGLPNIRRVADLKAAGALAGNEAVDLLAGADGFAEVYPEDKYIVVQHLQAAGHVTGMTGDGVNDAPALRQAEVGIAVNTATDVAKGAASVVLTEPGLTNIVALVEQGRTIYQRVLTWIINKLSWTILKTAFVAIAFVVTGRFVMSAFAMLLLVFMTDFAKISLATDNVRPSKQPETWNIGGFITVSVVLGVAMVVETLLLLWFGWSHFGLATNNNALYTFSFLMLLYFAAFSVVSARERSWFWATLPSKTFLSALAAEAVSGTVLTFVGLPGLKPLPWWQTLGVFGYAMVSCLVLNDAVKVAMIKWRVPNAVAVKAVDT